MTNTDLSHICQIRGKSVFNGMACNSDDSGNVVGSLTWGYAVNPWGWGSGVNQRKRRHFHLIQDEDYDEQSFLGFPSFTFCILSFLFYPKCHSVLLMDD